MKVSEIAAELFDHQSYKSFIDQHPNAFLCAGFFIIDLKEKSEKIQLDFFIPSQNKVAAFEFPFTAHKVFDDEMKNMKELSLDLAVDLEDLEQTSWKIITAHESALRPTKIIAVLKDNQWNLTCMDDHLGIVRIKLDALTGEELSFDKGSLMDFMGFKNVGQ